MSRLLGSSIFLESRNSIANKVSFADLGRAFSLLSSDRRTDDVGSGRVVRSIDLFIVYRPRGERSDRRWILVSSPFRSSLHSRFDGGWIRIDVGDSYTVRYERTNIWIALDAERTNSKDGFR